jgi:FAD synthase
MQAFDNYKGIPSPVLGCVVAIGNFDGVHKGHCALLAKAAGIAARDGKKLAVLTCEGGSRFSVLSSLRLGFRQPERGRIRAENFKGRA